LTFVDKKNQSLFTINFCLKLKYFDFIALGTRDTELGYLFQEIQKRVHQVYLITFVNLIGNVPTIFLKLFFLKNITDSLLNICTKFHKILKKKKVFAHALKLDEKNDSKVPFGVYAWYKSSKVKGQHFLAQKNSIINVSFCSGIVPHVTKRSFAQSHFLFFPKCANLHKLKVYDAHALMC